MDSHPIATPEQHAHERQALALTQHPIVKAAYERVRKSWLEAANPGPDMRSCFDEAFAIARKIAANDRIAVTLTKQAINRSADIMGMRQALLQGLEIGVLVEASETPESREVNEILEKQGPKAATAWREARLARELGQE